MVINSEASQYTRFEIIINEVWDLLSDRKCQERGISVYRLEFQEPSIYALETKMRTLNNCVLGPSVRCWKRGRNWQIGKIKARLNIKIQSFELWQYKKMPKVLSIDMVTNCEMLRKVNITYLLIAASFYILGIYEYRARYSLLYCILIGKIGRKRAPWRRRDPSWLSIEPGLGRHLSFCFGLRPIKSSRQEWWLILNLTGTLTRSYYISVN